MIWFLRIAFLIVIVSMLVVTTWASLRVPIWEIPAAVGGHPWFVATLFDAYFGFLTFYAWVFYKETSPVARILWFFGILLLGNIAMAAYMLWKLFKLPSNAPMEKLLLRDVRK